MNTEPVFRRLRDDLFDMIFFDGMARSAVFNSKGLDAGSQVTQCPSADKFPQTAGARISWADEICCDLRVRDCKLQKTGKGETAASKTSQISQQDDHQSYRPKYVYIYIPLIKGRSTRLVGWFIVTDHN